MPRLIAELVCVRLSWTTIAVAAVVAAMAAGALLPSSQPTAPLHTSTSPSATEPTAQAAETAQARPSVADKLPRYKSPHSVAFTPNGRIVCVTYAGSDRLALFDARTRRLLAEIPVGATPHGVAVSPDGRLAYVAAHHGHSVSVVDLAAGELIAEWPSGAYPEDVLVDAEADRLYVTNLHDDTVSEFDTVDGRRLRKIDVGEKPLRLAMAPGRKLLVTCDSGHDESRGVSIVNLAVGDAAHPAYARAAAAQLEAAKKNNSNASEEKLVPAVRSRLDLATNVRGVAVSPRGDFALTVHLRSKSRLPSVDIDGGWVITNAISRVPLTPEAAEAVRPPSRPLSGPGRAFGKTFVITGNSSTGVIRATGVAPLVDTPTGGSSPLGPGAFTAGAATRADRNVIDDRDRAARPAILDEPGAFAADPTDVRITPDGRHALVTSAGSNSLLVVDLDKLDKLLRDPNREVSERFDTMRGYYETVRSSMTVSTYTGVDSLTESRQFVVRRIGLPLNPRYSALSPDGRELWVSCTLDDSVAVVTLANGRVSRLSVGTRAPDTARRGEQIFNDARFCQSRAFTCNSCHPDGGDDGTVWNLAAERSFGGFLATKSLLGCGDNASFGWMGERRHLGERVGDTYTRTMQRAVTRSDVEAVSAYLRSTVPLVNPAIAETDDAGRDAVRRGRALFFGKAKCSSCHNGERYTSGEVRDVGTGGQFQVPSLRGVWASAPYLHHSAATTLKDVWDPANNPQHKHGKAAELTPDEREDLLAFLRTL